MTGTASGNGWPRLSEVIEAFESALADGYDADVLEFVPAAHHPERLAILCELVRVDLEHRWAAGEPRPLEQYRAFFPALFDDRELVLEMAYEEYRLRLQAGESPTPAEYLQRFGIEGHQWPSVPPSTERGNLATNGEARWPSNVDSNVDHNRSVAQCCAEKEHQVGVAEFFGSRPEPWDNPEAQAEMLRSLDRTDPHAAERLADALAGLRRVDVEFLGFRLCGELGRGAFGRVFLARQGDLGNRLVALKVSADVTGESHALARLQHTNIVPIYSVHRQGSLQAVCMPYLGVTTLADTLSNIRSQAILPRSGEGLVSSLETKNPAADAARAIRKDTDREPAETPSVDRAASRPLSIRGQNRTAFSNEIERLRGLGYIPAVLWIAMRVADGLAHAHERGILHRDLKPANILFADDGEPVLLDFNLAADTTSDVAANVAMVGGTLPYMAPEQLAAFRDRQSATDARSDIYALGVIVHEFLTGAHPFPVRTGSLESILPQMIADRLGGVPDIRRTNSAISPAVASIVQHCLEANPAHRYQTARQLHADLRRQLDNLPLRYASEPSLRERLGKWARRHPRLTSSTSVGLASAILLVAVIAGFLTRQSQYRRLEATDSFRALSDEVRQASVLLGSRGADTVQVDEGIALCQKAARRFGVLEDPRWSSSSLVSSLPAHDRIPLRENVGWLLFLWARAVGWQSESMSNSARQAELIGTAIRLNSLAEAAVGESAVPRTWLLHRADLEQRAGRAEESRRLHARADAAPAESPRERLFGISEKIGVVPRADALAFLQEASRSEPQHFATWLRLGNLYVELAKLSNQSSYLDEAEHCYGVGIALRPDIYWAYLNRGILYLETKNYARAQGDFDQVIALRPDLAMAYINRALARLGNRDYRGANADLSRALEFKDAPTQAYFIRARARASLGDREGAARDRDEGLRRQPADVVSWVVRGLAKLPADPQGALSDFDAALALNPNYDRALQNKANVLSERLGRTEDAVRVLDTAVAHNPGYAKAIAGRGVLLARLGRRDAAIQDARTVLAMDDSTLTVYQAACIYALTSKQSRADHEEAIRLLSNAVRKDSSWLAVARKDHDLDPIRDDKGFQDLLRAFDVVVGSGSVK
jgi:serine/threonine protein kinase/Flp pilus assembly protein TadD